MEHDHQQQEFQDLCHGPVCTSRPHSSQFSWQGTSLRSSHVLGSGCERSCVTKICEESHLGSSPMQHLPLAQKLCLSSGLVLAWVLSVPDCWSWPYFVNLPCLGCRPSSSLTTCLEITQPGWGCWLSPDLLLFFGCCEYFIILDNWDLLLFSMQNSSLFCLDPFKWLGGLGGQYKIHK